MTNKNLTRKALLMSALSLLLCVSMLVGTTFAWFTDSVTSANNIIKSGNLDVELYYQLEKETGWTKVDANTNVFKQDTLWEPGHTEVVKLKIVNEGSLALKYQLGVNVAGETESVSVLGDKLLLSEHIKFGIVAGAESFNREQAVAAVEANGATPLKTAYSSAVTELLPLTEENTDNEDIVTMVVYMPTSVGNEANHAKDAAQPIINLGLNLYATQVEAEYDSFGNNYDTDATFQIFVDNAEDLQAALDKATPGAEVILTDNITASEPFVISGSDAATYAMRSTPAPVVLNLNGNTITGNGGNATIKLVGANVVIKDSGNGQTGKIVHSSSDADGIRMEAGAKLRFVSGAIESNRYGIYVREDCDLTFSGGTINASSIGLAINKAFATTVNGGNITGRDCSVMAWSCAELNVTGGEFHGWFGGLPGSVTGGTFEGMAMQCLAAGYETWEFANRTFTVHATPSVSLETLIANAGENDTINVPAGIYTFNASGLKAGQTLQCAPGTIFKGESNLAVNGATVIGATFSNPSANVVVGTDKTVNGTFKNCTFEGGSTIYNCIPGDTVVFENCTFASDGAYAVHFVGLYNKDISFINCDITGWAAFTDDAKSITFDGCNFKDNGRLGGVRFYGDATLTDCTFDYSGIASTKETYGIQAKEKATVTVKNCTNKNGAISDLFSTTENGQIVQIVLE